MSYKFVENHRENILLEIGKIYTIISDRYFCNGLKDNITVTIDESKGNGWYVVKRMDNNHYELISPLAEVESPIS
jgi:hypothetical protein